MPLGAWRRWKAPQTFTFTYRSNSLYLYWTKLILSHWMDLFVIVNQLKLSYVGNFMTSYSSCLYWQSWRIEERQGCSQGFHSKFPKESWFSTGFTDLLCSSTASSITARMEWKAGSVSGVSGVVSEGSLVTSNSSGGSWYVTYCGMQKQTCVWKQAVWLSG